LLRTSSVWSSLHAFNLAAQTLLPAHQNGKHPHGHCSQTLASVQPPKWKPKNTRNTNNFRPPNTYQLPTTTTYPPSHLHWKAICWIRQSPVDTPICLTQWGQSRNCFDEVGMCEMHLQYTTIRSLAFLKNLKILIVTDFSQSVKEKSHHLTVCDLPVITEVICSLVTEYSITNVSSSVINASQVMCSCYSVTMGLCPSRVQSQIVTDGWAVTKICQKGSHFWNIIDSRKKGEVINIGMVLIGGKIYTYLFFSVTQQL